MPSGALTHSQSGVSIEGNSLVTPHVFSASSRVQTCPTQFTSPVWAHAEFVKGDPDSSPRGRQVQLQPTRHGVPRPEKAKLAFICWKFRTSYFCGLARVPAAISAVHLGCVSHAGYISLCTTVSESFFCLCCVLVGLEVELHMALKKEIRYVWRSTS